MIETGRLSEISLIRDKYECLSSWQKEIIDAAAKDIVEIGKALRNRDILESKLTSSFIVKRLIK